MGQFHSMCDRNRCYFCGLTKDPKVKGKGRSVIEKHHIQEQHLGGSNEDSNLVPACSNCHSLIHEGRIRIDKWYFSTRGWILHYWQDEKEYWGS